MNDSNAELGIRNYQTRQGLQVPVCIDSSLLIPQTRVQDKGLAAQKSFSLNSLLQGIHTSNPVIPAASNRNRGSSETAEINP